MLLIIAVCICMETFTQVYAQQNLQSMISAYQQDLNGHPNQYNQQYTPNYQNSYEGLGTKHQQHQMMQDQTEGMTFEHTGQQFQQNYPQIEQQFQQLQQNYPQIEQQFQQLQQNYPQIEQQFQQFQQNYPQLNQHFQNQFQQNYPRNNMMEQNPYETDKFSEKPNTQESMYPLGFPAAERRKDQGMKKMLKFVKKWGYYLYVVFPLLQGWGIIG